MLQNGSRSVKKNDRTLAILRGPIHKVARQYGVKNVRVFGSFARGEQCETSDIDLLVDLPNEMTLFQLSGLKIALEEALKMKVDVIPSDSIKPALRNSILSEARTL